MSFWHRVSDWLKKLFGGGPNPSPEPPAPIQPLPEPEPMPTPAPPVPVTPPSAPVTPPGPTTSLGDKLRAALVVEVAQDLGQRETQGNNRSPRIDQINEIAGVPLGSSYCTSGATEAWERVCKRFGLKNPLGIRAGSQDALEAFPTQYRNSVVGETGDFAAFTDRGDSAHGHWATLIADSVHVGSTVEFKTIEYNTNGEGSRDGDGVYQKTRTIAGTPGLRFRAFLNIVQWTLDHNGKK